MKNEIDEFCHVIWRNIKQQSTNNDVKWFLAKYLDAKDEIKRLKKKLKFVR